jgi:hypothetical protein
MVDYDLQEIQSISEVNLLMVMELTTIRIKRSVGNGIRQPTAAAMRRKRNRFIQQSILTQERTLIAQKASSP